MKQNKLDNLFAERLKSEMKYHGMTQVNLAKKTGISFSSINGYLYEGKMPRADAAVAIAKVLGTSVEYLITGEDVDIEIIIDGKLKLTVLEDFKNFIYEG